MNTLNSKRLGLLLNRLWGSISLVILMVPLPSVILAQGVFKANNNEFPLPGARAQWYAGSYLNGMQPVSPVLPLVNGVADAGIVTVPDVQAGEPAFVMLYYDALADRDDVIPRYYAFFSKVDLVEPDGESSPRIPDEAWTPPFTTIGPVALRYAAFSPDGTQYASLGSRIWLRNIFDDEVELEIEFGTADTDRSFLSYSPDGSRLLVSGRGENAKVEMWKTDTGQLLYTFEEGGPITFSPSGSRFITTKGFPVGRPWPGIIVSVRETDSGNLIQSTQFENSNYYFGYPLSYGFSFDQRILHGGTNIGASYDLNLHSDSPIGTISGLCGFLDVYGVSFTGDSTLVATTGFDFGGGGYGLHIHSMDSERVLLYIRLTGREEFVLFSPDGRKLLVNNKLYDFSDLTRPRLAIHRDEEVGSLNLFRSHGVLESSHTANGPWNTIESDDNPYPIKTTESSKVFRIRQE